MTVINGKIAPNHIWKWIADLIRVDIFKVEGVLAASVIFGQFCTLFWKKLSSLQLNHTFN